MSYAVIQIQGKQYKVQIGDQLSVDRLPAKEGDTLEFPLLLVISNDQVDIGTPQLNHRATVKVLEHAKGKKIRVATYKAKSRYRRVKGHRQHQTKIEILNLSCTTPKTTKKSPSKKSAPKKTSAKKSTKTTK